MKKNKLIAFTLVELIITITILIILTSISYFYLTSSIKDAKDRTRIADLNSIKKVLSIYKVKNGIYPYVSNSKIEEIDGKKWIVGVFGEETFRETKMLNSIPVDPDSGKYYKYMLSEDKSKFILEANLNNDSLFTLDESLNNNKNINDSDGSSGDNNDNVENPDIPPQYIPPAPGPETNIDCFTFRSTTGDNYEITGYKSDICPDSYEIVIPKTYNGKNISSIGSSAFKDVPIFRLFIPSNVIKIGNYAFAKSTTYSGTNINELIIGELNSNTNNIISIDAYAFQNNDIRKITLGNSVKNVDANIFNKAFNNLSYLNLGNRIESIGNSTFANQKLSSLVIPDSITTIGSSAFKNNSITSVHIPNPNCTYTNAFDSHVTITN